MRTPTKFWFAFERPVWLTISSLLVLLLLVGINKSIVLPTAFEFKNRCDCICVERTFPKKCEANVSEFIIGKQSDDEFVQSLIKKHNHSVKPFGTMKVKPFSDGEIVLFENGNGKIVSVGCM